MILFEKTGNCDKIRVWNYGNYSAQVLRSNYLVMSKQQSGL